MSSSARKFIYPIPTNGVIQHEHPRHVGLQGLVDASNWLYSEGEFRTRGGTGIIGMEGVAGINLLTESLSDAELTDGEDSWWTEVGSGHTVTRTTSYHQFHDHAFRIDWGLSPYDGVETNASEMPVEPSTTYNFSFYYLPPSRIISDTFWLVERNAEGGGVRSTQIDVLAGMYEPEDILRTWVRKGFAITTQPTTASIAFRIQHDPDQHIPMEIIDGLQLSEGADLLDWEVGIGALRNVTFGHRPLGFYQLDKYNEAGVDPNMLYMATDKSFFEFDQGLGAFSNVGDWPADDDGEPENLVVFRGFDLGGVTQILAVNGQADCGLMYKTPVDDFQKMITEEPLYAYPMRAKAMAIAGDRVLLGNAQMFNIGGDFPGAGIHYWDGVYYSLSVLEGGFSDPMAWSDGRLIRLADTPGEIVAMQEMGALMVAVYKTDAIYVLSVQSGLYPFRPELRSAGISGPASSKSVTALNDNLHVYLARNSGLYLFDGSAPRSLGNHIQDYLRKKIDINKIERSFVFFDHRREELWVFYPALGTGGVICNAIMVSMSREGFPMWPMSWNRNTFDFTAGIAGLVERDVTLGQLAGSTLGDMAGVTLGSFTTAGPYVIFGNSDGMIYTLQNHAADMGVGFRAFFETGTTDLEEPSKLKTIIEEQHLVSSLASDACTVTVKFTTNSSRMGTDIGGGKSFQAALSEGPYTTEHRTTGREFSHLFEVQATDRTTYAGSIAAYRVRGAR